MSFDLGVWYSPRSLDATAAGLVYHALAEGVELPGDAPVAASPRVPAFITALGHRYPDLDTLDDAEVDRSPWAGGFEVSECHALLSLRWTAPDEVVLTITALAADHGLVLYDPQGGEVHLPPSLQPERRRWQFWRR